MTVAWYLTCSRRPSFGLVARADELGSLPPSSRVIERPHLDAWLYEAFVDGGSLSAVYTARLGRRALYMGCLRQLALALLEAGGDVGVMRAVDETPSTSIVGCTTLEAFAESDEIGWWTLDLGLVVFRYRVEARLWAPLTVDGSAATGFFADYEVAARSSAEACAALRVALAEEGAWTDTFGAPRVVGVGESELARRVTGRAFFGR